MLGDNISLSPQIWHSLVKMHGTGSAVSGEFFSVIHVPSLTLTTFSKYRDAVVVFHLGSGIFKV